MDHSEIPKETLELSDRPSSITYASERKNSIPCSYKEAIHKWKTVKDVSTWIALHFSYDIQRAIELADNSETRERASIYTPVETYNSRRGSCVDLSRFTFETLQLLNSTMDVKYLMIEFEPIKIGTSILKRHWMISYKEQNEFYTMADTKQPGHIGGPYNNMGDFIAEYQEIRKRKIIQYKLLDTYKKRLKSNKRLQACSKISYDLH
jgi:hypothetical protein